jgi:allantoin racemase
MKVLIINPNTNAAMTQALTQRAKAICPPGVTIQGVTVPYGPPTVSRRRGVAVAATAVLSALAENREGLGAAVIGAFADPGLDAARESMPFPVVGLLESSIFLAAQLGARIGLVYGGTRMIPGLEERLRAIGMRDRVCGIRTPPEGVRPTETDDILKVFGDVARDLITNDRAEVIVLGGGALIGLASRFEELLSVPVIDSVDCAVLQAYALASLNTRKPKKGSYSMPPSVTLAGMVGPLKELFSQ